jgi:hypothetical protein
MNAANELQHGTEPSMILLYVGGILLLAAIALYVYAGKKNRDNNSKLKREEKAALKKQAKSAKLAAHALLTVSIASIGIHYIQQAGVSYEVDALNFGIAIEVKEDPYYGDGHSDEPVDYEMAIPTSGTHSPHDLKFGFYDKKPAYEYLVHNLEHGDIIIHYRPDADDNAIDQLKAFAKYREAGAGVLAVPGEDIPDGQAVVVTAWTRTMELAAFDARAIGQFIYDHINRGPEQIPASIRRGGGTM